MNGEIWVESPSTFQQVLIIPGSKFSFTIEVYSNERLIKALHAEDFTTNFAIKCLLLPLVQNKQRMLRFFDQEG